MHSQNLKIKNQFSIIFIQSITEKKIETLHSYREIQNSFHSFIQTDQRSSSLISFHVSIKRNTHNQNAEELKEERRSRGEEKKQVTCEVVSVELPRWSILHFDSVRIFYPLFQLSTPFLDTIQSKRQIHERRR